VVLGSRLKQALVHHTLFQVSWSASYTLHQVTWDASYTLPSFPRWITVYTLSSYLRCIIQLYIMHSTKLLEEHLTLFQVAWGGLYTLPGYMRCIIHSTKIPEVHHMIIHSTKFLEEHLTLFQVTWGALYSTLYQATGGASYTLPRCIRCIIQSIPGYLRSI
jgi:hypothetical protein